MEVDLSNSSIAQWYDEGEFHRCGYCKHPLGSISYGMMAEELTVETYKDLIDRGWRRSGKYCYKPIMDKTCCPQYTIRCDATQFKLNKSHKKIMKKFNKFIGEGELGPNTLQEKQEHEDSAPFEMPGQNLHCSINLNKVVTSTECNYSCDNNFKEDNHDTSNEYYTSIIKANVPSSSSTQSVTNESEPEERKNKKTLKCGAGADPNKPPCKKAKVLRLERKKDKTLQKGQEIVSTSKTNNTQKSLKEFIEEISANAKHKFTQKLVCPSNSDEWNKAKDVEFALYKKYQTKIHDDPPEKVTMSSFVSFLVSSPLKPQNFPGECEGSGYGSFHQQYWVDDKLIAVGVIDILPGCISSVYFFYDPDYRVLTLGTYGSLREIYLVQTLYQVVPDLRYYYMGFYIHSCPKMRYKGKLNPSFLLCPETYDWFPIEPCLPKLDTSKYSRLNEDIDALDNNTCSSADIKTIKIIYRYKLMFVRDYITHFEGNVEDVKKMVQQVGKKSAKGIIFWID